MKVDDLISLILSRCFREHYGPARVREFKRDERALMQAVARYGHECMARGWHFEEAKVFADINQILDTMRKTGATPRFLPVYLEGAVDRHVRMRADELREEALNLTRLTERTVDRLGRPVVVVVPSGVEILDRLWRDLKSRKRRAKAQAKTKTKQEVLL